MFKKGDSVRVKNITMIDLMYLNGELFEVIKESEKHLRYFECKYIGDNKLPKTIILIRHDVLELDIVELRKRKLKCLKKEIE